MYTRLFFPALFIILLSACADDFVSPFSDSPEEGVIEKTYPAADERLWEHFAEFEQVAADRGIILDLRQMDISGVLSDIDEHNVVGTCQYGTHIQHVTVDLSFWNRASQLGRELVVFHELGHCVFFLDHTESADANGLCLSIMNSGTSDCRLLYNATNRDFYLDEMFSQVL